VVNITLLVKWCLANSISSYVTTPVSAQDLASALVSVLESNTVSPVSVPNDVTFDILLAEDNLVNRKPAVKIVEKYGHTVEVAENGTLEVDAFKAKVAQNKPFGIILVSLYHFRSYRNVWRVLDQMDVLMLVHGRYAGYGADTVLRDAHGLDTHSYHCSDGSC